MYCPVDWGCKIHRLHLCRELTPFAKALPNGTNGHCSLLVGIWSLPAGATSQHWGGYSKRWGRPHLRYYRMFFLFFQTVWNFFCVFCLCCFCFFPLFRLLDPLYYCIKGYIFVMCFLVLKKQKSKNRHVCPVRT